MRSERRYFCEWNAGVSSPPNAKPLRPMRLSVAVIHLQIRHRSQDFYVRTPPRIALAVTSPKIILMSAGQDRPTVDRLSEASSF
ncbi:hypothetical protein J6590_063867 [Homalodisca vitripennis]|nr:hypothetical protein J6590_063867 [Homalodisca vitripennis]